MNNNHQKYMQLALKAAQKAGQMDEVPVGAVLVGRNGDVLSQAYNQTINFADPTAHAEILALRKACQKISNYRLPGTALYVTMEPCIMCMGAIVHARVSQVIFGVCDPKWGAAGSLYDFANDLRLNHRPEMIIGVCEDECKILIQEFFRAKRNIDL